ncbi:hypothetical protein [Planctomycetes bacterium K23_9]|uniref:Uncharacterized protein n=1 Tax=Stieleria marina TaxID=1930275 RepID=A0A517NPK0_9BACT|nr:hypothetical protein K239x_09980 [Planctomycetes bacterium K23_9]
MFQRELNDQQLRYFGASLAGLFVAFGAVAYWNWQANSVAAGLTAFGVILAAIYYLAPNTRRPIYRGFAAVTKPIQVVATIIILAIVYYGILTPIGVILQCSGRGLRSDAPHSDSFWTDCKTASKPSRYFDTY